MGLEKICENCKYNFSRFTCDEKDKEMHCFKCCITPKGMKCFLSKESEYPKIKCSDCIYYENDIKKEPCSRCENYSKFNAREEPPRLRKPKTTNIPADIERFGSSGVVIIDDIESNTNQDNPTSDSETGADKIKEMIATAVNNFHFSLDPCKMCKYEADENTCKTCCYYYASEFEPKEMK